MKTGTIHRKVFQWPNLTLILFRSILGLTETLQHAFCVGICNKNTLRTVCEKNLSVSWILLQNLNSMYKSLYLFLNSTGKALLDYGWLTSAKNTFGRWEKNPWGVRVIENRCKDSWGYPRPQTRENRKKNKTKKQKNQKKKNNNNSVAMATSHISYTSCM